MTGPIRRNRNLECAGLVVLLVLATTRSFGDAGATTDAALAVERLELLEQFTVPAIDSNPRDLRWASNDSVVIGFETEGIAVHTLAENLPIERTILASTAERYPPFGLLNLALSGDRLQACSEDHHVALADPHASSADQATFKKMPGYCDDIDVRDDTVALLGYPTAKHFGENEQTFLWLGDLRSGLEQWVPLGALREDRGELYNSPGIGSIGSRLGSVRFLKNGDLLVVPGFKPGVYQFSRTGKQRLHLTTEEIEGSLLTALGVEQKQGGAPSPALEAKPATRESSDQFIRSQRILVEDVIPVRDKGALVVRHGAGKDARYYLAMVDSGLTWYALPIHAKRTTARVRGDFSQSAKRLAFLVTSRNPEVEDDSRVFIVSAP